MIIKDVMSKDVITILDDSSVTEAKAIMNKNRVNKLPVIDKSNKLVGLLTKNDLAKAAPSDATTLDVFEIGYLLSKLKVSKVMAKNVITVDEDEVVEEAARVMCDNKIGCVPVMKNGLCVGMVTESDLFALFTEMFGARQSGIRGSFILEDIPGQVSKVSEKIAEKKGNLISVITQELPENKRRLTLKVTGITMEEFKSIIENLQFKVEDIRIV